MGAAKKVRKEVLRAMVKMGIAQPYQPEFFAGFAEESRRSAQAVAPIVIELLSPRSVVDVGCGTGTWLAAFAEQGIADFLGIDGDYLPREQLQIPIEKFVAADLSKALPVTRRFDLAVSLEVAEHLPRASAEQFVASLTGLAPAVLFSAAIPDQGGTGHINEQWQGWWAGLFAARGYRAVDAVRPRVWADERVSWWYRQNAVLFADAATLEARPALRAAADRAGPLDTVHPALFARVARRAAK